MTAAMPRELRSSPPAAISATISGTMPVTVRVTACDGSDAAALGCQRGAGGRRESTRCRVWCCADVNGTYGNKGGIVQIRVCRYSPGHGDHRESRLAADRLVGRQGIDDRQARGGGPRGRRPGSTGDVLPGAVLRAVLLPGAGHRVLRLHRADPRRSDDAAVPVGRQGARHGDRAADVRGRAGRAVLQHRGRHRRRWHVPRQVPQAAHPAGQGVLGEVLLPPRQRRLPDLRHRGRQGRRVHLLRPPLPRGLAGARPQRRRDRVQPVGDQPRPVRVHLARRAAGGGRRQHVLRRRDQPGRHRAARRRRLLRPELLRRSGRAVRRRRRRRATSRS